MPSLVIKQPPPPSAEEYAIPREIGRETRLKRIDASRFSLANFLGTTFDPSASTMSYRLFVWKQNLLYFTNFDLPHMLFRWPNFAYRVDIQGTESSIIKELEDYGLIGFTFTLIIKILAARKLWAVSRIAAIAATGYYLLAAMQPTFTTLGTCVLFWLLVLTAASTPESLKPSDAWCLRLASILSRTGRNVGPMSKSA